MSEAGGVYLDHTESVAFMDEELKIVGINPKIIVTVVGSNWPLEFNNLFPKASIYSFDSSKAQIREFGSNIVEATGHRPVVASVPSERFEDLIQRVEPDFLFLSNIPDDLEDRDDVYTLIDLLDEYEIPVVVFSALGKNLAIKSRTGNAEILAEELEEMGYKVKRLENKSNSSEVGELYIATLSGRST